MARPRIPPQAVGTIPDQAVRERETAWFLAFAYFEHPGEAPLEYSAASADAHIAAIEVLGSRVTITGVAPGTTTVGVTARDPHGLEAFQQVPVTVERVNRRPEAVGSIPEQTVNVGETVELDLAPYFTDPDGDPLQYEADVLFDSRAEISLAGSVMTIVGLREGSTAITAKASDPDSEWARQVVWVTVEEFVRSPEVVATMPEQTVIAGDKLALDVAPYFGDPDRNVVEYEANSTSEDVVVSMSGSVVTIAGVSGGRTFVVVKARNPDGRIAFPLTVTQLNRAPVAVGAIPAQAVTPGKTTVSLDVSAYFRDPDQDPLAYSAATSDESVATVSVRGSEVTIRGVTEGSATVTVTVRDPAGLGAEQSFAVTVWGEDGVTADITGCRVIVNLLLVRTVHIVGSVRASRSVRGVEVHAFADGKSAGVSTLGDMEAGEEKAFFRSRTSLLRFGRPRCSIDVAWRDVPQADEPPRLGPRDGPEAAREMRATKRRATKMLP